MKHLALLLALVSSLALADECKVHRASQSMSKHQVGEVTDLVKTITQNKCNVKYQVNINGEWHKVNWTTTGPEQGEFLCNLAIQHGRTQLLTMIPDKFEAEEVITCKEGQPKKNKTFKVGYEGLESEFGRLDNQKYFKYKGANCRKFRERYTDTVFKTNIGIICQNDNELWTVVDKW